MRGQTNLNDKSLKRCFVFDDGNVQTINVFNTELLLNFVSKRGLILPRRLFDIREKYYSRIVRTIKFAKTIYLLPFS